MSVKKLDEASVTSMINSFLANKKKSVNEAKKKKIKKKKDAFWTSIVESLLLNEIDREDPDDWKQQIDFSSPTGMNSLGSLETGGFRSDGEEDPSLAAAKSLDKTHGKRAVTGSDITDMVSRSLRTMRDRDPKGWAEYQALDDKGKQAHRIKLGRQLMSDMKLRREREATKGTARTSQQKREEVIGNIVPKIVNHLVELTRNGKEIPTNISNMSRKYLGFDAKKDTSKAMLGKLASLSSVPDDVMKQFVSRALASKDSILKFAATKMDQYPGDWQDQAEDFANKQNLPAGGAKEAGGTERGIGSGKRLVGGDNEEIKDKVVQRAQVGGTPLYRMFKDYPIEDIMQYFDYFEKNPKEIERSAKERIGTPPESMKDITGRIASTGEPEVSQKSEIGSDSAKSILTPDEAAKARAAHKKSSGAEFEPSLDLKPKEILSRLTDFGADGTPDPGESTTLGKIAKGLANTFNAKDERLYGAVDADGNRSGGLKSELARLAEPIRELAKRQDELSPEEEKQLSILTRKFAEKRKEFEELKNRPKAEESDVIDIIRKLSNRDSKGAFKGLKNPDSVGFDDPVEAELAHRIFSRLNPSRLNVKASDGGDAGSSNPYNLKNFLPGFADAEEEKVAANIPAVKKVREYEKNAAKEKAENKEKELAAIRSKPSMSRDEVESINKDDAARRTKVLQAMAKARQDKDKEKEEADKAIGNLAGDAEPFERISREIEDIAKLGSKETPLNAQDKPLPGNLSLGFDGKDNMNADEKRAAREDNLLGKLINRQSSIDNMKALRDPARIDASIRGKTQGISKAEDPSRVGELQSDIEKLKQIRPHAVKRTDIEKLPSMQQMYLGDLGAQMSAKEKRVPSGNSQKSRILKRDAAPEKPFDLPSGKIDFNLRQKGSMKQGTGTSSAQSDSRSDEEKLVKRKPGEGRPATGKVSPTDVGGTYKAFEPDELPTPKRLVTNDQPTNLKKGDKVAVGSNRKKGEEIEKIDLPSPHKLPPTPVYSKDNASSAHRGRTIDPRTKDKAETGLPDQLVAGDASFKYGKESEGDVKKRLVKQLVQHAKRQVNSMGQELTPENILKFIVDGFAPDEEGETLFPQKYNAVKDFLINKGKDILGKHGLPHDIKVEGKRMKSILELLVDIGSEENKHAEAKQSKDGWDKAKPAKRINMVPSKLTLKELFKEEDK